MRQLVVQIIAIATLALTSSSAAEPSAPRRIDGGILTPTSDALKELISACIPFRVVVAFVILEDGTTADLGVIEAEPEGVDTSVLMEAVSQFQYEPIIVDGVPVRSGTQTQAAVYDPKKDPNCSSQDD